MIALPSKPGQPFAGKDVFVSVSPKGGPGKTESCDAIEAVFTLGGSKCLLVDADDGNRGLFRRVGADHVIKVSWDFGAPDASGWLTHHAGFGDRMIFDLGAGIDSADMPVMSFLGSVWKLLHEGGARIVFACIVSTNAPVSPSFVERAVKNHGRFGDVVILANNQDGSGSFPVELDIRPEPRLQLRRLQAGVQSVRLMRKAPLSSIIAAPSLGYGMATALMASRLLAFAKQPVIEDLVTSSALERLKVAAAGARRMFYDVATANDATDSRLAMNADLAVAHRRLLVPDASNEDVLEAALAYRLSRKAWMTNARA